MFSNRHDLKLPGMEEGVHIIHRTREEIRQMKNQRGQANPRAHEGGAKIFGGDEKGGRKFLEVSKRWGEKKST